MRLPDSNSPSGISVPVAVVAFRNSTRLLKIDQDYEETVQIVKAAFDIDADATVVLLTDALPGCKGRLVEIDPAAYPFVANEVSEIRVSTTEEKRRSMKGKSRESTRLKEAENFPQWTLIPASTQPLSPTLAFSKPRPREPSQSTSDTPSTPDDDVILPDNATSPIPPSTPFTAPIVIPNQTERSKSLADPTPLIDLGTPTAASPPEEPAKPGPANILAKAKQLLTNNSSTSSADARTKSKFKPYFSSPAVSPGKPAAGPSQPFALPTASGPIPIAKREDSDSDEPKLNRAPPLRKPVPALSTTPPAVTRSPTPPRSPSPPLVMPTGAEDRFDITITGPEPDQIAQFKTRGAHSVKKVLSAACKAFNIPYESACMYNTMELANEQGEIEHLEFECKGGDSLAICGINAESKLIVRRRTTRDTSGDELF